MDEGLSNERLVEIKNRAMWGLTMTSPDMGGVSEWAFDFREPDGRRSPGLGANSFRGTDSKVMRVAQAPMDIAELLFEIDRLKKELRDRELHHFETEQMLEVAQTAISLNTGLGEEIQRLATELEAAREEIRVQKLGGHNG